MRKSARLIIPAALIPLILIWVFQHALALNLKSVDRTGGHTKVPNQSINKDLLSSIFSSLSKKAFAECSPYGPCDTSTPTLSPTVAPSPTPIVTLAPTAIPTTTVPTTAVPTTTVPTQTSAPVPISKTGPTSKPQVTISITETSTNAPSITETSNPTVTINVTSTEVTTSDTSTPVTPTTVDPTSTSSTNQPLLLSVAQNLGIPQQTIEQTTQVAKVGLIAGTSAQGLTGLNLMFNILRGGFFFPFVGLTKRQNRYGKVFDAQNRKGIPFTTINLYTKEGKFVKTAVTDLNGIYTLLIPDTEKEYYLEVLNNEYLPILKNETSIYAANHSDLNYRGGIFKIGKEIDFMVPLTKRSGEISLIFYKLYNFLIENTLLLFGILIPIFLIISIIYFFLTYSVVGFLIMMLYVVAEGLIVYKNLTSTKTYGTIFEMINENKLPVADVFVSAFQGNKQISDTYITDNTGKYKINVPKGEYSLELNKHNYKVVSVNSSLDNVGANRIEYKGLFKKGNTNITVQKITQ